MMNVAFITVSGELVLSAFDKILAGCTAKQLLALAPNLLESGLLKWSAPATLPPTKPSVAPPKRERGRERKGEEKSPDMWVPPGESSSQPRHLATLTNTAL
uniref:Uncharacterized protein n=1 Tax=Oryza punctata TaxID=4537 RepID=A0A0E0L2E2_ORYPU